MENARSHAGLFADPSILTDVTGTTVSWLGGTAVSGYSLTFVKLVAETVVPALRALRLAGQQPVEIEITDLDTADTPEGLLSCGMFFDSELVFSDVSDTSAALALLGERPQAHLLVRIFTTPYLRKGTQTHHGLTFDLTGGAEWSLGPGRAADGPDGKMLTLILDRAVAPTGGTSNEICAQLNARGVQQFVSAIAPILASLLPAAQPTDTAETATPVVDNVGLLWVLDARSWYERVIFDNSLYARGVRTSGLRALPARTTSAPDFLNYLMQLILGRENLRKSIKTATGKTIPSYFRAGDFRRSIARWDSSGSAPFEPFSPGVLASTRNMPWLDLIFYMIEAQVFLPPFLELRDPFVSDDELPVLEPLVARRVPRFPNNPDRLETDPRQLVLVHTDLGLPGADDPYGVLATITVRDMPLIETETVYETPPPPMDEEDDDDDDDENGTDPAPSGNYPVMAMEDMFTWEYIPVDPDAPRAADANPLPILLIVAGPGVSVTVDPDQNAVKVEILRKSDYGIPSWGEPINRQELYTPFFRPSNPPLGLSVNDLTYFSDGVLISEGPDGTSFHVFLDVELTAADRQPVLPLAIGDAWASFDIKRKNRTDGTIGYRADFDFVYYHSDNPEQFQGRFWPVLRIFRTRAGGAQTDTQTALEDITFSAAESLYARIEVEIYDTPDIVDVYRNWPHMVPLTQHMMAFDEAEGPDSGGGGTELATHAFTSLAAQQLPILDPAEFAAAGFVRFDASANSIPTTGLFSWTDFFLIIVDVIVGLHPYAIALDIAEFIYAWNTSRDRYGRPITNFDLVLMAAGIGLPVSGFVLTRGKAFLYARWVPPADALDDVGEATQLLDDMAKLAEEGTGNAAQLSGRATPLLRKVLANVDEVGSVAIYTVGNLMDVSRRNLIDPGLGHDYRRWLINKVMREGFPVNPLGGVS
ncbi:hypothetical protein [Roseivivax sp. CAU 1753]